ncbi:hypothetical protein [Rubrivirga sp.]|uniref:hypothetical protein n=1 Tax=Rubrivirga sp. TaxID=1885344 RepID=UPI003C738800
MAPSSSSPSDLVGEWELAERQGYADDADFSMIQDQRMTITDDGRMVATATMVDDGATSTVEGVMTYQVDVDRLVATTESATIGDVEVPMGDNPRVETYHWSFEGELLFLSKIGDSQIDTDNPDGGGDLYRRVRWL